MSLTKGNYPWPYFGLLSLKFEKFMAVYFCYFGFSIILKIIDRNWQFLFRFTSVKAKERTLFSISSFSEQGCLYSYHKRNSRFLCPCQSYFSVGWNNSLSYFKKLLPPKTCEVMLGSLTSFALRYLTWQMWHGPPSLPFLTGSIWIWLFKCKGALEWGNVVKSKDYLKVFFYFKLRNCSL